LNSEYLKAYTEIIENELQIYEKQIAILSPFLIVFLGIFYEVLGIFDKSPKLYFSGFYYN